MKPPSENYKLGGREVFFRSIIHEMYEAYVVENMLNEFIPAVSNVGGNATNVVWMSFFWVLRRPKKKKR